MKFIRAIHLPRYDRALRAIQEASAGNPAAAQALAAEALSALTSDESARLNRGIARMAIDAFVSQIQSALAGERSFAHFAVGRALVAGTCVPQYQFWASDVISFEEFMNNPSPNLVGVGEHDGGVELAVQTSASELHGALTDPCWHNPSLVVTLGGDCTALLPPHDVSELHARLDGARTAPVLRFRLLLERVLADPQLGLSCGDA